MQRCFNSKTYPDCHYLKKEKQGSDGCYFVHPSDKDAKSTSNILCGANLCQYGIENRICEVRNRLNDLQGTLRTNSVNSRSIEEKKVNALADMILLAQKLIPNQITGNTEICNIQDKQFDK